MPEALILKQFASEVKEVKGERALNVTITTNDVDRSGDIVEPGGAKLTNFKKNPVVLMSHDYSGLPIGRAEDLIKTDNGITAKVVFPEEGVYPLADTVYNLYKGKFMRAWSIGFIPIKSEDIVADEDNDSKSLGRGKRFKTWELLEFSACSVPANPHALTNMIAKGINIEPLKEAGFIEIEEEEEEEEKVEYIPLEEIKKIIEEDLKDVKPEETDELIEDNGKPEKEFFPEDGKILLNDMEINKADWEEFKSIFNIDKYIEQKQIIKDLEKKLEEFELKAGAVLNAKNKSNLKQAQELIQSVLDSAGTTEEDSVVIDDIKDDEGDDDVVDIVTDTVDNPVIDKETNEAIEEEIFKARIEAIINQSMTDNRKYFNEKLDYMMGRVPKIKKKGSDF